VVRPGRLQRYGPPHAEARAERARAVVEGIDQQLGLRARQALDAERAREAHERAVEPLALELRRPGGRLPTDRTDHIGPLAGQEEHGQAVFAAHERQLAARGERRHERLGPEMLVYVDPHRVAAFGGLLKQIPVCRSFLYRLSDDRSLAGVRRGPPAAPAACPRPAASPAGTHAPHALLTHALRTSAPQGPLNRTRETSLMPRCARRLSVRSRTHCTGRSPST